MPSSTTPITYKQAYGGAWKLPASKLPTGRSEVVDNHVESELTYSLLRALLIATY